VDIIQQLDLATTKKQGEVTTGWLREFSSIHMEECRQDYLHNVLAQKKGDPSTPHQSSVISKAPSLATVQEKIDSHTEELSMISQFDFNIHRFMDKVGRKVGMSAITLKIMQNLGLEKALPLLDASKMTRFLGKIYQGYRRDVEYHNDIHGADVLQMMFIIIKQGDLLAIGDLNELDLLSILIGCVCHDFAHDGLNNAYHVNSISERAIRYNDQSVQENFHVAEAFSIMNEKKFNFMSEFSRDEFKTFRKRCVGMILATDMARHVTDLSSFKSLLEQRNIREGANAMKIIDHSSAA